MQFIDKVKIHLKAGNGGDGIASFRHEKYVPLGGPDGGDGGRGGSVIFKVDTNKSTLLDLRFHRIIKAGNGERGKNKKMFGADGNDVIVAVPQGTLVKRADDGYVIADLVAPDQEEVICEGGAGGKGNRHFATSRNTAPEHFELGIPGEEFDVIVELKLLADVGLIGYPSVGKSTLLSVVSSARPEIADYPFTTLTPQLGMVKVDDSFSFVMADLPGLIEGASQGKGLGHDFLKHIERCRLLIHVLDMGHEDPVKDYEVINEELKQYPGNLEQRPQLIVANKMDEPGADEKLQLFREKYPDREIFPMSTALHDGIQPLLYKVKEILPALPMFPVYDEDKRDTKVVYTFKEEKEYEITRDDSGMFIVKSPKLERRMAAYNLHLEEDALRFARDLRRYGIDEALRKEGCTDGDDVMIGKITFTYMSDEDPDTEEE
ncbi:MAG: GTPase ObgE [Erysipelotrichaceae bacterium]|nr:GTPase ObgE [Erysipelotrichaceae bacterium]